MSAARISVLAALLFASAALSKPQPGLPFLLIWPTARSTALAGAMTGLADDPDAAFFNPAGLAYQSDIGATASYGPWLPAVYPGMWQGYFSARMALPAHHGKHLAVGVDAAELNLSDLGIDYVDQGWPPPPRAHIWRAYVGAALALRPLKDLGVGLKLKYVRSALSCYSEGYGKWPDLGARDGGTGSTLAADVGVLWKPTTRFSLGGSVANLGPGISYPDQNEHDPSPTILRVGACWSPLSNGYLRIHVLPEVDKVMVGMFSDSMNTIPFGQELLRELDGAWKALAVEVTALRLLAVRIGYFEDRDWQRGGLVFRRYDMTRHYTLYDLLTRRELGRLESVGLCWGFGVGNKDYFRIDVSSDAAIYDFPTRNWKLSLVANDIVGGIRELGQGHVPWEE